MAEQEHTASPESVVASVRRRIKQATGGSSYKELARGTGCNAETVRRQLTSGTPSMEFIMALCQGWNLNANWLLFGTGPQHGQDLTSHVLCEFKSESVRELVSMVVQAIGDGLQGFREAPPPTARQNGSPESAQPLHPVFLQPSNQSDPPITAHR